MKIAEPVWVENVEGIGANRPCGLSLLQTNSREV